MKITFRSWVLIIALLLAVLAISPSFKSGVMVSDVDLESQAALNGIQEGMIIKSINGNEIKSIEDYHNAIARISPDSDEKVVITGEKQEAILFTNSSLGISVSEIPKTKIKTGLDLSGGARALMKPVNVTLNADETDSLIAIMNERLNVYGIKDIAIRPVRDLEGNNFILVEMAGATPEDIHSLLAQQGKFEAKVGNLSAFKSDDKDIADVCRNDATCSGISECVPVQDGTACNFRFTLYLTEKAAQRHADITGALPADPANPGYLSEKLFLYVDDLEVDSLLISEDLKGQATTQISIQGSETGSTQEEALKNARASMNRLQTILITGSLPYKLEIVKLDTISPLLGKEFTKSLLTLAVAVFLIVSLTVFIRYRKIKITLAVILTMISEALLTLGIAALLKWNLDAPSIAGIIAGIGTGINDQIVIIDESVSNRHEGIKERIKRALFIIIGAFFTIVAAMLPLFWAGAGMLRGFAFTTIIGVTVGILITRPAFADIIKRLEA